jgi:hypothetical protein
VFFLENQEIFLLDENQEGIPGCVCLPIAFAMMLNFDDNGSEPADVFVHEKCSEGRVILAAFSLVPNRHSQNTAVLYTMEWPFHRLIELKLKIFKISAIGEVMWIIRITDEILYVPQKEYMLCIEAALKVFS